MHNIQGIPSCCFWSIGLDTGMVIERLPLVEKLSIEEKWVLVDELWSTLLANAPALPSDSLVVDELERRMTEYEAHPESGVSWETLRDRLADRL